MKRAGLLFIVLALMACIPAHAETYTLRPGGYAVPDDLPAGWYLLEPALFNANAIVFVPFSAEEAEGEPCPVYEFVDLAWGYQSVPIPLLDGCRLFVGAGTDEDYDTSAITYEEVEENIKPSAGAMKFSRIHPISADETNGLSGKGEYVIGQDYPAGWYTVYVPGGNTAIDSVYLTEGAHIIAPYGIELEQRDPGENTAAPSAGEAQKQTGLSLPDAHLLYEDEYISIVFSDFRVETYGDSSYTKLELLIENKTDELIEVTCDSIVINGCAVHISKFVDVPAKSKYLNEWTNNADMYLKYGIKNVETVFAMFSYQGTENIGPVRNIQSNTIQVE